MQSRVGEEQLRDNTRLLRKAEKLTRTTGKSNKDGNELMTEAQESREVPSGNKVPGGNK